MKKLSVLIGEALLPIALARTALLRAPVTEPSAEVKQMMALMKTINKGLGAGPGQAWATLTGMVTGNKDILKAAELAATGPNMYQIGAVVAVTQSTLGHSVKKGEVGIVYSNGCYVIFNGGTNYIMAAGEGDQFKTDVRPATDEEIKAYCSDLPSGAMSQLCHPGSPLNLLINSSRPEQPWARGQQTRAT